MGNFLHEDLVASNYVDCSPTAIEPDRPFATAFALQWFVVVSRYFPYFRDSTFFDVVDPHKQRIDNVARQPSNLLLHELAQSDLTKHL